MKRVRPRGVQTSTVKKSAAASTSQDVRDRREPLLGLPRMSPFPHVLQFLVVESLEPDIGDESDADLIDRIHKAADTLELLFAAWARYELEEVRQQERCDSKTGCSRCGRNGERWRAFS